MEIIAEENTLYRNALWLPIDDATECLQYNIRAGVRQRDSLIEHIENTENRANAGMEKEDLGLIVCTF